MQYAKVLVAVAAGAVLAGTAWADDMQGMDMSGMPGMDHHHHHHDDAEVLGHVSFPTSCKASSREGIEHGVALLHSFGYVKAQQTFAAVTWKDPGCAMAHWGIAMTQYQELWGAPDPAMVKLGASEMAKARALASKSKVTGREKAYIDALSAFFAGDVPFMKRADAYAAKMDALHAKYPGDVEGAAFDALAILADTPPSETDLTHPRRALAILKPLFKAHPDHPGLAHYIIHTCDTPRLAEDGLEAARAYAKIAPASAHALHMPAHIFARLGMWDDDIKSNEASVKASEAAEAAGQPGAAHQMHADEFLIYAYLQTGQSVRQGVEHRIRQGLADIYRGMRGVRYHVFGGDDGDGGANHDNGRARRRDRKADPLRRPAAHQEPGDSINSQAQQRRPRQRVPEERAVAHPVLRQPFGRHQTSKKIDDFSGRRGQNRAAGDADDRRRDPSSHRIALSIQTGESARAVAVIPPPA
jgi:hypothetical protein